MAVSSMNHSRELGLVQPLKCLDTELIARVDEALCRVGEYGEVQLVIVKGRLRFIHVTQKESVGRAEK